MVELQMTHESVVAALTRKFGQPRRLRQHTLHQREIYYYTWREVKLAVVENRATGDVMILPERWKLVELLEGKQPRRRKGLKLALSGPAVVDQDGEADELSPEIKAIVDALVESLDVGTPST